MKKILIIIGLLVVGLLVWAGSFFYQNLRGVAPAVLPPSKDITEFQNTTGLPLTLPAGFSIEIFSELNRSGNPRVMVTDFPGSLWVSVPDEGKVVWLADVNGDGKVDRYRDAITNLNLPHGLAVRAGKLYVAETDQVAVYDIESDGTVPGGQQAINKKKIIDLPGGGNHFSRTIGFGPDGRLYITIGSSCNVCREKDRRRAAMLVANADGSNVQFFAEGLRNTVFFTWHPKTRELWGTDMGRDMIGDNLPPEEINIIQEGKHYGWPYCYGKQVHDKAFDASQKAADFCNTTLPSHIEYQAHSAPLGLAFIPDSWPAEYRDDLLVAYHGSWNRTEPTGYKIVRFKLDEKGKYQGEEDFITGWLTPSGILGRPVDLVFDPKGILYISDDKAGVIYRVTQR